MKYTTLSLSQRLGAVLDYYGDDDMRNFNVEINFNDLVDDMFADADIECEEFGAQASPSMSFKDALRDDIVKEISTSIIKNIKESSINDATAVASEVSKTFVESELEGILLRKLRSGEVFTKYEGIKSFDELIEKKICSINIDSIITRHVDRKAEEFAKELKIRYDNVFAAKIVSSLKDQKMLSPDVAKLLLGE